MAFAADRVTVTVSGDLIGVRTAHEEYDAQTGRARVTLQVGVERGGDLVPDEPGPGPAAAEALLRLRTEQAARDDAVEKLRKQVGAVRLRRAVTVGELTLTSLEADVIVEGVLEDAEFSEPRWTGRAQCNVDAVAHLAPAQCL